MRDNDGKVRAGKLGLLFIGQVAVRRPDARAAPANSVALVGHDRGTPARTTHAINEGRGYGARITAADGRSHNASAAVLGLGRGEAPVLGGAVRLRDGMQVRQSAQRRKLLRVCNEDLERRIRHEVHDLEACRLDRVPRRSDAGVGVEDGEQGRGHGQRLAEAEEAAQTGGLGSWQRVARPQAEGWSRGDHGRGSDCAGEGPTERR